MSKTKSKQLQLYEAIKKSDLPTSKDLIKSMSPEDIMTPVEGLFGMTVLDRAVLQGDKDLTELIVEKNPKIINRVNDNSINAILDFIVANREQPNPNQIEIFKLIINHPDFDSKTLIRENASLMHYIASSTVNFCEELHKKFPELVEESLKIVRSGYTPFDTALYGKRMVTDTATWIFNQIPLDKFKQYSNSTETLGRLIKYGGYDIAIKIIEKMSSEILHSFHYREHSVLYHAISIQHEKIRDLLLEKMQFEKFDVSEQQALITVAAEKGYDDLCLQFSCKFSIDQLDSEMKITLLSKAVSGNCEKFTSKLLSYMSIDEVNASNALQLADEAKMPNIHRKIIDKILPSPQAPEQTELEKLQKEFIEFKEEAKKREADLLAQIERMQRNHNNDLEGSSNFDTELAKVYSEIDTHIGNLLQGSLEKSDLTVVGEGADTQGS